MAPGADAAPTDARWANHADGRRGRCRIRRQQHPAADAASAAAPLCAGNLADPDGVSGHADSARRSDTSAARESPGRAGPTATPLASARSATALPPRAWRRVTWRNGTNPPWEAHFAALRVTPATDWRHRRLAPEIWLLCERGPGPTGSAPPLLGGAAGDGLAPAARAVGASAVGHRAALPEIPKPNWASTTSRGGLYPGWQHHIAISAVAYTFLQTERLRPRTGPRLTFPRSAGLCTGNLYRAAVDQPPAGQHAMDERSRAAVSSATHLTKSY